MERCAGENPKAKEKLPNACENRFFRTVAGRKKKKSRLLRLQGKAETSKEVPQGKLRGGKGGEPGGGPLPAIARKGRGKNLGAERRSILSLGGEGGGENRESRRKRKGKTALSDSGRPTEKKERASGRLGIKRPPEKGGRETAANAKKKKRIKASLLAKGERRFDLKKKKKKSIALAPEAAGVIREEGRE